MAIPFQQPEYKKETYNCPHCNAFATQSWGKVLRYLRNSQLGHVGETVANNDVAICTHCKEPTFWNKERMVFPSKIMVEEPNESLPDQIRDDYLEAAKILYLSPRGAVALLRLCIQNLLVELGEKDKSINDGIKSLVAKGLSPEIQQSLDYVRVVGNNAVHPGEIDLKDDTDTATKLFGLVNLISERMISYPKKVASLYSTLPENAKNAIDQRDGK